MGGASCAIPHLAILRPFVASNQSVIPTDPKLWPEFDAKLVRVFEHPEINRAMVDDEKVDVVCAIMSKSSWSAEDRKTLNDLANSLYT